jgi:hypothetical protein
MFISKIEDCVYIAFGVTLVAMAAPFVILGLVSEAIDKLTDGMSIGP